MRLLTVAILSVILSTPVYAHRRHTHKIPLPKERIVKDANTIQCVADTAGCGVAMGGLTRAAGSSNDSDDPYLRSVFEGKGVVPAKYTEEDISTLLRQNYDNINNVYGWWDHEASMVVEPEVSYPVLLHANAINTRDISNRRVSISLETIILVFTLACQALFLVYYVRDDRLRTQKPRPWQHRWRRRCVSLVGLGALAISRLPRLGMRITRPRIT